MPVAFEVEQPPFQPYALELMWDAVEAPDVVEYAVYRGATPDKSCWRLWRLAVKSLAKQRAMALVTLAIVPSSSHLHLWVVAQVLPPRPSPRQHCCQAWSVSSGR